MVTGKGIGVSEVKSFEFEKVYDALEIGKKALEAIDRVRELHKSVKIEGTREGLRFCGICSDEPNNLARFPCYTIMALDGEQ